MPRPGIARPKTRPAPFAQRELHALLHPSVQIKAPSLRERFSAWVRSRAARLMSFGLRRRKV